MRSIGHRIPRGTGNLSVAVPGPDGAVRFTFEERNRDDWSVYLYDDSRGYIIQLDTFKKHIRVRSSSTSWAFLYSISDARRLLP